MFITTNKKILIKNLLLIFLSGMFVLIFAGYCALRISKGLFGHLEFYQVFFHLMVGGTGTGFKPEMLPVILKWSIVWFSASLVVIVLCWVTVRQKYPAPVSRALLTIYDHSKIISAIASPHTLLCLTLAVVSFYSATWINREFDVVGYIKQPKSAFIEDNFARLKLTSDVVQPQRRNLITLVLESMESGYSDASVYGEDLIPELNDLMKEGISFSGYQKTAGSKFTLDGICAEILGVPLVRLGFDIHEGQIGYDALLKNSPSIYNLLSSLGYRTAWFSGVTEKFTSKGDFFEVHGFKERYAKEYWQSHGWALNDANAGSWDYNDYFLFARLQDYLADFDDSTPFALLFETVDTHFPNGFVHKNDEKFHDGRDAFMVTSRQVGSFIAWAKQQKWWDNTTVVIIGDHPWQDFPNGFSEFTKHSNTREIYNVFLNPAQTPNGQRISVARPFSPMDIAPTILDVLGIGYESILQSSGEVVNDQIGLGVSLFSDKPNLVEKMRGGKQLEQELNKASDFYSTLF